jgi:hypothetical protein
MFLFTSENPDFWIQLKGSNAGKPLHQPIPNSIGVLTNHQVLDPMYFFYVIEYLFTRDAFRPYLKGSVIPYITHTDISKVILSHFTSKTPAL